MSVTDNRTHLCDGEASGNVSGDTTAAPAALSGVAGTIIEGSDSIEFQCDDAQEALWFDQDTAEATFSIDMSDVTMYLNVKFGLGESFANLGGLLCLKDAADGAGGDGIGYAVNGNDVAGLPYRFGFAALKLDVSVVVATPGTNDVDYYQYFGTEAGLAHATIVQVGYGTFSLVKAVSSTPNAWCDGIYYIANDSYAATISGGTSGTPETMPDVVGDDETDGMAMFNNPKGSDFGIFAPTEWGDAGSSDSYFTSITGEQLFFIGDNAGGHTVGTGHFPQRLVSGSGVNSWVLNGAVLVNVGTRAQWDLSDGSFNIIEVDGGLWAGFSTIALPSSGGTSRYTRDVVFSDCDTITNNGADMDGCSIFGSIVAADAGALVYNEASDPDGTLDNLTLESGAAAHHAIDFGTAVDSSLVSITLRGIAFNGFGAVDDANASTLRFLATTGSLTVNLIDCTVDGVSPVASGGGQNFSVDDAAGITVTVVVAPVTLQITCTDEADLQPIQDVQTSIHLAASPFTELMNEDTTAGGIASESYAGVTPVDIVWKTRKSDELDDPRYGAQSGLGEITSGGFTLAVLMKENTILP